MLALSRSGTVRLMLRDMFGELVERLAVWCVEALSACVGGKQSRLIAMEAFGVWWL
jgi:hypothetical protein